MPLPRDSPGTKRPGPDKSPEGSPKRPRHSLNWPNSVGASPLSFVSNDAPADLAWDTVLHELPQFYDTATHMDWEGTGDLAITNTNGIHDYVEPDQDIICYGAIMCEAKASSRPLTQPNLARDGRKFHQFDVVPVGQYFAVSMSGLKDPFAHLDRGTCLVLQKLNQLPGSSKNAVIDLETLKQLRTNSNSTSQLSLSINIYGPVKIADRVAATLSQESAFLQDPFVLAQRYRYFNPQIFRSEPEMEDLTHFVGLTELDFKAKILSDEVDGVLQSLGGDDIYPNRYSVPLIDLLRDKLNTELMDHQVKALGFVQTREDHNWHQEAQRHLRLVAELHPKDNIPCYSTGGIIADIMGLGKTLTMLSTIVLTADDAARWVAEGYQMLTAEPIWRTRATLIVVTSMQVLNVWEMEIERHIKPGILKTSIFHGNNRAKTPQQIIDNDIVLTTYGLLVSDFKKGGHGMLQHVHWYRVALDEAHWIRNQSSRQFEAAMNLKSLRRWCLSGTPIQNRLDDLVSLLKFLHFEPFCRSPVFNRHILEPLSNEDPNRTYRLQSLLRTICLRRSETLLNLPKPQSQKITVTLKSEERALYTDILKKCAHDIDQVVSSQVKIKKYSVLFTAIMKLRRVCNHGIVPVDDQILASGITSNADQDCEMCGGTNEDNLGLVNPGDICTQCGKTFSPTLQQISSPTFQLNGVESLTPPSQQLSLHQLEPSPSSQHSLSSKLQAVVDNLSKAPYSSKSLVFTYWTATLDQLQRYLRHIGVPFRRIDGKVSYKDRLIILEQFRDSPDIPVLLMSIQTGAVGLNLTVANYVHIIEPQWNPSVEEQAIARAVRMGQTRTVTVIRYIVRNSVEEVKTCISHYPLVYRGQLTDYSQKNIMNLQRRKRNLAKFTLDSHSGSGSRDGLYGSLDDLKFVLDFDSIQI